MYLSATFNMGAYVDPKKVKFEVTIKILAIDQFYIDVVVQPGFQIDLLHFSMIGMDKEDI